MCCIRLLESDTLFPKICFKVQGLKIIGIWKFELHGETCQHALTKQSIECFLSTQFCASDKPQSGPRNCWIQVRFSLRNKTGTFCWQNSLTVMCQIKKSLQSNSVRVSCKGLHAYFVFSLCTDSRCNSHDEKVRWNIITEFFRCPYLIFYSSFRQ